MKNKYLLTLLIILVIVIGSVVYVFSNFEFSPKDTSNKNDLTKYETVTDSDDVELISKDLDETNVDDVDREMLQIETELDASLAE